MLLNKIAYIIATGFGSGYIPLMPGTTGSLVALLLFIFIPLTNMLWLIICLFVFFAGTWTAKIVEKEHGKDPGLIVIDEFVGQWISLLFLPRTVFVFVMAFFVFRFLDIFKPFPANVSQKLPHGWGIMTDDVIAGIYTNMIIQLTLYAITG